LTTPAETSFDEANRLRRAGDIAGAIVQMQKALRLDPSRAMWWSNYGVLLYQNGDLREATVALGEVTRCNPRLSGAHTNLARIWRELGNDEAAGAALSVAVELDPNDAVARSCLGNIAQAARDYAGTLAHYRIALQHRSDDAGVLGNALHCMLRLADWTDFDELWGRLASALATSAEVSVPPFMLLSLPASARQQLLAARAYTRNVSATSWTALWRHRDEQPGRRLRIGYANANFNAHPVARLLAPVIEQHDSDRLELFAYAYGSRSQGPLGARLRSAIRGWRDAHDWDDRAFAQRIADDGIDVLIDLNGHTSGARPRVFAARPAPVQISYLGFLGSCGAPYHDYLLTDAIATPASMREAFTERLLHLPASFVPRCWPGFPAIRVTREAYGLPERAFVLCTINNSYKILPARFFLWLKILKAVPDSVLWLLGNGPVRERLSGQAARHGVDPARLVFAGTEPYEQYRARFVLADLYLDTTPYNAVTTAIDALSSGLPVLTQLGDTMISRSAASILHATGCSELVAANDQEFFDLAIALAYDRPRLAAMRRRIEDATRSGTANAKAHARALEDAYAQAWRETGERRRKRGRVW
jgi:predicted O-linked N-acetylglucosamine transferase (SPINDLY family)